jgi:signal transduction histidine kinase
MSPNPLRQQRAPGIWRAPAVLFSAYAVALILLAASALLDYQITHDLEASGRAVARTLEAIEKLRQTGNAFFVAESSQRGYVITGKESYLGLYREMHEAIGRRLDDTSRVVSEIPRQAERLTRLRQLAKEKFDEMDRTLDAYRSGGQAGAIALISADEGMETILRARETIIQMLGEETRLLAERRAAESAAASGGRLKSILASGIVGLALTLFYLLMLRYLRERDTALAAVESSNTELEQRVTERTAELSDLSRHLLNIREDEKKSIARDLHDEFGSYLTAINMDVSRVRDKIAATNPEQAVKLDRTLALLNQTIDMKRRLISDLRPSILDNLGLGAALEQYIDEWSRYNGVTATFDFDGDLETEEEGCPIAIFRVFQEALNNVAKHSGATAVTAYVRRVGDAIDFEIADNGIGLSDAARSKPGTHGLLGIRERVLAYHGRLEFLRRPDGGTVLRASLPCKAPQAVGAPIVAKRSLA